MGGAISKLILYFIRYPENVDDFLELVLFVIIGIIGGLICALPAVVVALGKKKSVSAYLIIHAVSGAIGGLALGVLVGIGTTWHALKSKG